MNVKKQTSAMILSLFVWICFQVTCANACLVTSTSTIIPAQAVGLRKLSGMFDLKFIYQLAILTFRVYWRIWKHNILYRWRLYYRRICYRYCWYCQRLHHWIDCYWVDFYPFSRGMFCQVHVSLPRKGCM